MFTYENITEYQIEITTNCNAACPQCPRNINGGEVNPHLPVVYLDRQTIDHAFPRELVSRLRQVFFCGSYGDPIAHPDLLDILRDFRSKSPTVWLYLHTNGGIRSPEWWTELAGILNGYGKIDFGIDGLEDTNHIYRVNVKWTKVLENTQAFIRAGGIAHWDMLVFKHNQHQVDCAEYLAHTYGFKWFRAKVSKRHSITPISFLHPPIGWEDPTVASGTIECYALKESSVYISTKGIVYPCCWLGYNNENTVDTFKSIQDSWINIPLKTCAETCTINNNGTSFTNQWQREVAF